MIVFIFQVEMEFLKFSFLNFIFHHFVVGFDVVHFRFHSRHYRFGFVFQLDQLLPEKHGK
jgi:hypothetical protein